MHAQEARQIRRRGVRRIELDHRRRDEQQTHRARMLTQAILLGRLPPSGAPGGVGRSCRGPESALSVLIERPPRATRAARIRSNGWLGCNAPDNRIRRIAWE